MAVQVNDTVSENVLCKLLDCCCPGSSSCITFIPRETNGCTGERYRARECFV